VNWFLKEFAVKEGVGEKSIADGAMAKLMAHDWPGNVRELKNIIERLVITVPQDEISANDVPLLGAELQTLDASVPLSLADSLREAKMEFEKKYIVKKLLEFDGNISKTAEAIGLERSNLHRKIKRYRIDEASK